MRLPEDLTGLKASDLSAMEAQIEPLQAKIKEEREKLFLRACHSVTLDGDYGSINEEVQGKLSEILADLRFARNEIVLGSLYELSCMFADGTDVAELLVNAGLFTKNFYYFSDNRAYEDYKFEEVQDLENYKELVDGVVKYFDPIAGEEVSKSEFEENLYYTLSATELYKEMFDTVFKVMNMLVIK